ncbi:MAG: bifunctional folylpolyglutamate synthase/dihydrofolate synthase [Roseburia sp.]|nr:bifunctional folylpolyglutamate synthase/dihydrofolate synthase [Roseburia sp.]
MTYEEAKLYIEKVSQTGSILGLENIQNLMRELGDVQEQLHIIHIAGTNGKGSTGAFIESALIEAGYQVGRYTSPAVFEPFEVWRINRENISMEDYLNCLEKVQAACERMLEKGLAQPTVFEVETALAFLYFYEKKCDYVLLEVGMGGETDATNLITKPVCSVITSISMDHMQFLGNSLGEIARVKAGIIKAGCPVVTGSAQRPEVMCVIKEVADQKQAELFVADAWQAEIGCMEMEREKMISNVQFTLAGISYYHKEFGKVQLKLAGTYQIENSILAATVCKKVLQLSNNVILRGLEKTGWPGRFEVVSENPLVILDGAHNEDAAEKLSQTIQKHFTNRKITYIIGVLADKAHAKMLELMLPYAHHVYTVTPPKNKRALDGDVLAEEVRSFGKEAVYCENIRDAATFAVDGARAGDTDVIVAFGSLSYLSALKRELMDVLK